MKMNVPPAAPSTPARVLICEDDPATRSSLQELVARRGYEVSAVADGAEALRRLQQASHDLLLLDLNLPGLRGEQVIAALRESGVDTTVLVISGESSVDAAVQALKLGAHDFLRKPYAPEELFSRIEAALRERRLARDNRRMQAQLHESEQLHRFFVEHSPDLIFLLDHEGRFAFINERAETLLGYRREELIGQHHTVLIHADDRAHAEYGLTGQGRDSGGRSLELRLLPRGGGEPLCFETQTLPVASGAAGARDIAAYGVARDISDRKKAEEIISFQASHDLLTRLPNRALLKDRLALAIKQAQRDGSGLAVMYVDLDRFKLVNDTLGHVIGDALLQTVALRIKHSLREVDTLARVGGDEFVLVLTQVGTQAAAGTVAHKLMRELDKVFVVADHELYLTASLGVALYPADGSTADSLIHKADIAMYAVKSAGRHGHRFYAPEMDGGFSQRLALANDLHRALDGDQLRLHYQPQYDIVSRRITGVEALIRWQHPRLGLLAPTEFLPIAEETGTILPLGHWVLRKACAEMARWRAAGAPPVQLAVNFSATQIEQPDFAEMVRDALDSSGIAASQLEIEITEDGIMKNMASTVQKLARLAGHGVRVAIDDFGMGYSSLSYLRSLPIHTIKIDRSFVQDVPGKASENSIVTAIVNMAKGLALNTIAEGVETQPQMDFLRDLGCSQMQGFLFSRAVEPDSACRMLVAQAA